jgi:hypothetical protein
VFVKPLNVEHVIRTLRAVYPAPRVLMVAPRPVPAMVAKPVVEQVLAALAS